MLTCSARTVGAGMQRGWPAICSGVRPSACCSEDETCSVSPPGKAMNRDTFPEAVLNGQQLDLFALYREVATRGGFKCAARVPPCIHSVTLSLLARDLVCTCVLCAYVHLVVCRVNLHVLYPKWLALSARNGNVCPPLWRRASVELVLGAASQAGQRHQLEVAGVHADAQLDQGQQHDRRRERAQAPLPGEAPLLLVFVAVARLLHFSIVCWLAYTG
jgi:hypothetical protein